MKKNLVLLLVVFVVLASCQLVLAKDSSAKMAQEAKKLLSQAVRISPIDAQHSAETFQKAFQMAITLTNPELNSRWQELGLAIAARCLHPDLFPEAMIAAETYLEKYPKGKYLREVLVAKALLDAAFGRSDVAIGEMKTATKMVQGKERLRLESLTLDVALSGGYYREAESLLNDFNTDRKTPRFRRDKKRYDRGTGLLNELYRKVEVGEVTGEAAIQQLQEALEIGYFAPAAPAVAMRLIAEENQLSPQLHRTETVWMNMTRASVRSLPVIFRKERLAKFLQTFPQADLTLKAKALEELYALSLLELRDPEAAASYLSLLQAVPGFKDRAAIERIVNQLSSMSIAQPETEPLLADLELLLKAGPFDNGYWPVIDVALVAELRLLSNLFNKNYAQSLQYLKKYDTSAHVRGIPLKVLLLILGDSKLDAYREFAKVDSGLSRVDRKLTEDLMYPLYLPLEDQRKKLLAALITGVRFPHESGDVLVDIAQTLPRIPNFDHVLALLADLYQRQHANVEAQTVWSTLRMYYPHSVWVH